MDEEDDPITSVAKWCLIRSSDLINVGNHFLAQAVEMQNRLTRKQMRDENRHLRIELNWRLGQAKLAFRAAKKFRRSAEKLLKGQERA